MQLRICDGGRESVLPASMEIVEQAFALSMPLRIGTEITVAHGGRWLAALALEPGSSGRVRSHSNSCCQAGMPGRPSSPAASDGRRCCGGSGTSSREVRRIRPGEGVSERRRYRTSSSNCQMSLSRSAVVK